jgi:hypothetical protein
LIDELHQATDDMRKFWDSSDPNDDVDADDVDADDGDDGP